ncbi:MULTISPECIES: barstar family protein [Psychrobacter]|jgi:RNAse (barnase) inhibitor barstar|uniref:barstar family protein n=1 Tax=Psychrobacter TaxID=497 RepID=UPI000EC289EB|nr:MULTISPECIES: barstar family protein [Psychrobacter]HCN17482.1 hypothetical protein [Psychrobacter sp.]
MSHAIHYINQNGTAQDAGIPAQAVNIPVGETLTKNTLLTTLADACDFPNYCSPNWDSAWDCLTDSAVTHLTLNLSTVNNINHEDFKVFVSLIEDAYRDFGKPQLWVIMPPAIDV